MKPNPELKIGCFYWVMPVNDPDRREEWEYYGQPARFAGWDDRDNELWQCLGCEDMTWPVRWIGEEIIPPESVKPFLQTDESEAS